MTAIAPNDLEIPTWSVKQSAPNTANHQIDRLRTIFKHWLSIVPTARPTSCILIMRASVCSLWRASKGEGLQAEKWMNLVKTIENNQAMVSCDLAPL